MRTRFLTAAVVGCALAALAPAGASAAGNKSHRHKPKLIPTYYLALGDSLAQGAQPNMAGHTVATNQGYADDLYATLKKHNRKLKLEKLGCLGETTGSMIAGKKATPASPCRYAAGSQLKAAVKFMKSHRVALVTLDIGANDIDGCVNGDGSINFTCLANGTAAIQKDMPTILGALRNAGAKALRNAGAKVEMAGMTYYDPFLAEYLASSSGQTVAGLSVTLAKQVNDGLSAAYAAAHFKVADVATAFDTYVPFTTTATLPGVGTVPKAVASICTLTWMCAPAPRGPNIHANSAGYATIAATFADVL